MSKFTTRWYVFFVMIIIATHLMGCANAAYDFETCKQLEPPASPVLFEKTQDLNNSPRFRAGTVAIWNADSLGQGFLFWEGDTIKLGTVEHTAEMAKNDCTYMMVPGTKIVGVLNWKKFEVSDVGGSDPFVTYTFSQSFHSRLLEEVEAGTIMPLDLAAKKTVENLEYGELISMPRADTGAFTEYKLHQVKDTTLAIGSDGSEGLICTGRSGGPAVNSKYEVIGVIAAIDMQYKVITPDSIECSFRAILARTK